MTDAWAPGIPSGSRAGYENNGFDSESMVSSVENAVELLLEEDAADSLVELNHPNSSFLGNNGDLLLPDPAGFLSDDEEEIEDMFEPPANGLEGALVTIDEELTQGHSFAAELRPGEKFNQKIPPVFDGNQSFFSYSKMVHEWCSITTIDKDKRALMLRHGLQGQALIWKEFMENVDLTNSTEFSALYPGMTWGVRNLLESMKQHMIKDAESVYLWRLGQFHQCKRRNHSFYEWMLKWKLAVKKLSDSWMDVLPSFVERGENI